MPVIQHLPLKEKIKRLKVPEFLGGAKVYCTKV